MLPESAAMVGDVTLERGSQTCISLPMPRAHIALGELLSH